MRYIITESQYKLLVEQQSTDNWIYNWFKNAPEEKIRNTFSYYGKDLFPNMNLNKSARIPRPLFFTKTEILQLLSKKPKINVIDKATFDFINDDTNTGALYIEKEIKDKAPEYLSFLSNLESDYQKYKDNADISGRLKEIIAARRRITLMAQYAGTIIVPDNLKNRISSWGLGEKDIMRHEEMHGLYDDTMNAADNIIKKLCSSSKCSKEKFGNITKNTEVYSYLMTLRSKLNMSPIDVIISSKVIKGPSQSEIVITVNRNGKTITLKDSLPNNSATLKAMECCTGDISNSIKLLHNTLAKNTTPQNNNIMA